MGQQKSVNPLKGRVGTFSYYKSKNGFMARDKQGIEGKRIKSDPRYERVRENAAEFARATKGMKEIRLALTTILRNTSDPSAMRRLASSLFQVVKSDPVSARGGRLLSLGDLSILHNFQFNILKDLKTAFDPRFYTPAFNRETGEASISIQAFTPKLDLSHPVAANHFRFLIAGIEVDFDNLVHTKFITNSGPLPLDMNSTAPLNLVTSLPANSEHPLLLVFGVVFEDMVNEISYPLNDSAYNSLAIVGIDSPVA